MCVYAGGQRTQRGVERAENGPGVPQPRSPRSRPAPCVCSPGQATGTVAHGAVGDEERLIMREGLIKGTLEKELCAEYKRPARGRWKAEPPSSRGCIGKDKRGWDPRGSPRSVSPREVTLRGPGVQNNPPSSDSQLAPASFLVSFLLLLFDN